MRKVAIAYIYNMHDQFIDHAKSLWVAATGAAGTGAGATGKSAGGTVCKQASQVETKCINWVVIAYMHDQFIQSWLAAATGAAGMGAGAGASATGAGKAPCGTACRHHKSRSKVSTV